MSDMAGFLQSIGIAIAETVIPPVVGAITDEFARRLPELIEAVVRAVVESSANMALRIADDATDIIPGELDDMAVDIVRDIFGKLGIFPPRV